MSHRYPKHRKKHRKCPKDHYMVRTQQWLDSDESEHEILYCRKCGKDYKKSNGKFVNELPEREYIPKEKGAPHGWKRTLTDLFRIKRMLKGDEEE